MIQKVTECVIVVEQCYKIENSMNLLMILSER
jgi:hypothetical protein